MNMPEWTFITNHAAVLSVIAKNHRITGRDIAEIVGIRERAVREIIADLETEGYVRRRKEGRRVRYSINTEKKLRHQTQQEKTIRELLSFLK